jgi:DNA-binding HxlR family transcriptional regulator
MVKKLANSFDNATEFTLAVLSGKWKTTILCYLDDGPRRYGELRALISGLSDKVLTERLRDLRSLGLVTLRRLACSQSGIYVLTRRGKLLQHALRNLRNWGRQHCATFGVTLTKPPKRSRSRLRSH